MSSEKEQKVPGAKDPVEKVRPEAELESRLHAALLEAFPNIPRDDLKAQMSFTVCLGHDPYDVDAVADWKKRGRADLILNLRGRPLAVIEVKREDQKLTQGAFVQAQSYANLLNPRPPLVVITNGLETCVYDSHSGDQWDAGDDASGAVQKLLANAGKMAAADKRWAIEALMGRETELWVPAVRKRTSRLVASMTNAPGDAGSPYARDLLFPRKASEVAHRTLLDPAGELFTIVEGDPLAGKSNVIREIVEKTKDSSELAVLMLRGNRTGLFQALANLFSAELEWDLSPSDVRQWLRRMSLGDSGPTLVLAIDGVEQSSGMAADLEELPSLAQGSRLKVILTTDQVDALTKAANGRGETALGECACVVTVGTLDLDEFNCAREILAEFGMVFHPGAELAYEYRAPWLLRFLFDDVAREGDLGWARLYPPALGIELITLARKFHKGQHDLERGYRLLARGMLADEEVIRSELALAVSNGFLIRQDVLSSEARAAAEKLQSTGAVRFYRHPTGEDVVVPTVPAVFLSELGRAAADELIVRCKDDPEEAGVWLGWRLDSTYLADLAGAEALRYVAQGAGGLSSLVIKGLFSITPVSAQAPVGALLGYQLPDGSMMELKIHDGHLWRADRSGNLLSQLGPIDDCFGKCYSRLTAWMILGQFARLQTASEDNREERMDADILLQIGQNPFPLCRGNEDNLPYHIHEVNGQSMLCGQFGLVEPTTIAIADLLSRPWAGADEWVEYVLKSESQPLIYRVESALKAVQDRSIPDRSEWAGKLRQEKVLPALEEMLLKSAQNGPITSPEDE